MTRLAINGFGRIGRCVFRALHENRHPGLELVAINELAPVEAMAYLAQYDSTHGRFAGEVRVEDDSLLVNGRTIRVFHEADASQLPWDDLAIDLVIECSGGEADRLAAEQHLQSGAGRLLFSQPGSPDLDATLVYGVNHETLAASHRIVSAASCTTNCLAPILALFDNHWGLESIATRTLHAAMNDQPVIDAYHHPDLRRNRAAFESMIPVETQLARGIQRVLPDLGAPMQTSALRLPISDVSAMDIDLVLARATGIDEIREKLCHTAGTEFCGVMGYTCEPLVSRDFVHDPRSAVIDLRELKMAGPRHLKMLAWFDNEWGYANRILDLASYWTSL